MGCPLTALDLGLQFAELDAMIRVLPRMKCRGEAYRLMRRYDLRTTRNSSRPDHPLRRLLQVDVAAPSDIYAYGRCIPICIILRPYLCLPTLLTVLSWTFDLRIWFLPCLRSCFLYVCYRMQASSFYLISDTILSCVKDAHCDSV